MVFDTLKIAKDTVLMEIPKNSVIVIQTSDSLTDSTITGVISGILVTFIFIAFKYIVKPRVKISDKIVVRNRPNIDGVDELVCQIKLINKTLFSIENVDIKVFLLSDYNAGNGINSLVKNLELRVAHYDYMVGKLGKDKERHDNCYLITFKDDIRKDWNTHQKRIIIQVSSYHSKSGFRKVYTKTYKDFEHCIMNGKFISGETFDIIGR